MSPFHLLTTTEDARADNALVAFVQTFETRFPGRIVGYYLHGSQVDNTAIATSDLDLDVVIKDQTDDCDRDSLQELAYTISNDSEIELDIDLTDEATLALGADPTFKLGSRLLFGEDIRPRVPLIPIEAWGRERMHLGYFLLMSVFDRQPPVRYPLDFPDPNVEFFGYINRSMRADDGLQVPSTRNMIRVTGWLATALLAHEAGQYVVNKRECHRLFRQYFDDEWASLLEDIYMLCRGAWNYAVPEDHTSRNQLDTLCRRVLAFENHYLTRYKPFLIQELVETKNGRESRSPWLMERIPFDDPEILALL